MEDTIGLLSIFRIFHTWLKTEICLKGEALPKIRLTVPQLEGR